MKKILITLCARGGSKGIPKKNTKLLAGKPLIAYSVEVAQKFAASVSANVRIALSTDAEYIKNVALEYGLVTEYQRPSFLATDDVGKLAVWEHLLESEELKSNCRFDYLLDLDISSPLRTVEDLMKGYTIIESDPNALTLYSVSKSDKNPYFNMVEPNGAGYYELVKRSDCVTRQAAPPVYSLNASFYFIRREFFDQKRKAVINSRSLIYCMEHLCFDLDEPVDFEFLDYLIANKKVPFI
jgi:CMP-N-acetylneuraminic acid synthetase